MSKIKGAIEKNKNIGSINKNELFELLTHSNQKTDIKNILYDLCKILNPEIEDTLLYFFFCNHKSCQGDCLEISESMGFFNKALEFFIIIKKIEKGIEEKKITIKISKEAACLEDLVANKDYTIFQKRYQQLILKEIKENI